MQSKLQSAPKSNGQRLIPVGLLGGYSEDK